MASRDELARRIVREVWAHTGGSTGRWAMVQSLAKRLSLSSEELDRDLMLAKVRGWVEVQDMHRARLTDAGRKMIGGTAKR